MESPHPSRLDARDPAKAGVRDIRQEVERELAAYRGGERGDLVLLVPEDDWNRFLELTGLADEGGETVLRGVRLRKAAVTAVIAQEGF